MSPFSLLPPQVLLATVKPPSHPENPPQDDGQSTPLLAYCGGPGLEANTRRPAPGDLVAVKVFNARSKSISELFVHEAHIMARLRDSALETMTAKNEDGDDTVVGNTFGGHYVVEFYG